MLSNIYNYISSLLFFPLSSTTNNQRRRRIDISNNNDVNNIIQDADLNNINDVENLVFREDQLKYLPTGRNGFYIVIQLPELVTTTGRGVYGMYKVSKIDKLEGVGNVDRVYWKCAGKNCHSTGVSCRRITDGKDFNFQMKGNHSNSCDITKESIAERDIRYSVIENSRKVGVKQSSILRSIQDKLLNHIDRNDLGPSNKKQKITILEQPYSPNTINNISFNHNGLKAACSREAVKYRTPFQRLQDRSVNDINNGVTMRPQDKKYRDRDTEIFRLRDSYNNGQLPIMEYLNDVSTLFNNYDANV